MHIMVWSRVVFVRVFRGCYVDYSNRILYEDSNLLVVDKPPGAPCSPHVSNSQDCLDVVVSAQLKIPPLIR